MTVSLQALITPLSRQEVEASLYQVLAAIDVPTTGWKSGSVVRTVITGVSVVLSALSQLQAKIARSGFLELSEGDWLTLVAHYVYGVDRIEATFAEGEVTLVNAGGGIYELAPGDLIVANPTTGKTYRNTAGFTLGSLQTLKVPIRATEAGASTSLQGTITGIVSPPMTGVTVTNATAIVGRDAEADADLRTRCNEKLGALSPFGPWDAYAFAARSAVRSDGTSVGVTRIRQLKDGRGGVTTYVATASGEVTGDVDDPDTDLGRVAAAIARLATPQCVTATTASAEPVVLAVSYEAWAYEGSGLTDQQLKDAIGAKLSAFVSAQPIGGNVIDLDPGKVFRHALIATIVNARPEIFRVALTLPAGDVELELNEVPVLGTVLGTIHQVPAAIAAE